jgi:hypothetical protein
MSREEELVRKIANAKKELAEIEENKKNYKCIRRLTDISDSDKILAFDQLYKSTFEIVKNAKENEYLNEDDPHYLYEEVMQTILAKKEDYKAFWKYFGGLTD